jgi:hypothetical protein
MACLSSNLVYGATGVGKTALFDAWITWQLRNHPDGIIRLVTAEPSGLGTLDQSRIASGSVQVWDISRSAHFMDTMADASEGMWPTDVDDPKSPRLPWDKQPDSSRVIGIGFEGGTTFSFRCLDELRNLGANNQITGSEAAPARFKSGDRKIAGANQTMYGIGQRCTMQAINESHTIPVHLFWSCRELKFQDYETREFMYGPELCGKAATKHIPPIFGNTLHYARVRSAAAPSGGAPAPASIKRKVFMDEHYLDDDPTTPYIAQIRIPVESAAKLPKELDLTSNLDAIIKWWTDVETLRADPAAVITKS